MPCGKKRFCALTRAVCSEETRGDMARLPFLLFASLLWFGVISKPVSAQLRIDIQDGIFRPTKLAITDIVRERAGRKTASVVRSVLESDLTRAGLIEIVERDALIQTALALNETPPFAVFRIAGADALATISLNKKGRVLTATLQIWDVNLERPLARETLSARSERVLAHKIADAIYSRLTGEKGYFNSRILYVSEIVRKKRRWKRLEIMDADGANVRYLTRGRRTLVLNPRFSPDGSKAIYTALTRERSSIRLIDLTRKNSEQILPLGEGLVYAARFSPDNRGIVYAQSLSGNSEIFTYDLGTQRRRRLTVHPSIDTSPSFSPDGGYVAFVSDRSGSPQIYVMTRRGTHVQRVSFDKGSFSTPIWSPRGDRIAFTRQLYGRFGVGVMRTDGSDLRILAEGFRVEGPSWSPNGRVLVFFNKQRTPRGARAGRSRLMTVDVTGRFLRELTTRHNAYDPSWSHAREETEGE